MPSVHYEWGPSKAARLINCPGSRRLARGIPSTTSPWAEEGTKAHDVCEQAVLTGKDPSEFTDDPEMANAARIYAQAIADWVSRMEEHHVFVEVTLESPEIPILGGTADHLMWGVDNQGRQVLQVSDFKYGMGVPVSVVENEQLLTYCKLGHDLREMFGFTEPIDVYRLMIVQPRTTGNEDVQVWECTQDEVDEHYAAIKRSLDSEEMKCGSWCRWCPVMRSKEGCPEFKRVTTELFTHAEDEFTDEAIADWIRFHEMAPAVKKFLASIPEQLLAALKEGKEVPGYKAVLSHGNRKYNVEGEELVEKLAEAGVPKEAMFEEPKVKSPAKLEREGYADAVSSLTYKPPSGEKVVPLTARGEPILFKSLIPDLDEVM